jgi:hypothetical protein
MAWQEARDGRADDGVRAKDHLLYSAEITPIQTSTS